MADTFKLISIICMIIALIALIVAVILFFTLNIRKVIGDLSGQTAKKYVKNMQKKTRETVESLNYAKIANENLQVNNENTVNNNYTNNNYVNSTESISSKNSDKINNSNDSITAKLSDEIINKNSDEVTTVLENNATTVLDDNVTTVLNNSSLKINGFEIYLDIVVKHTNEKI